MGARQRESIEKRLQRFKLENISIREQKASLKKENAHLKRSLRERDFLFNSQPPGIILLQQGKVLEINEVLLGQLGHGRQEVIGRDFLDFIHPDQRAHVRELHNMWAAGKITPDQYDASLVGRDDETMDFEIKVRGIKFNKRKSFLLGLTRLEKRKEKERETLLFRKMEALVTMASGLNNRLRSCSQDIVSSLKGLRAAVGPGDKEFLDALKVVEDGSQEMLSLSRKLEAMTRSEGNGQGKVSFELNGRVNNAIAHVKKKWKNELERPGSEISLKSYLRASSPVMGEPKEIEEVIIQLITNAIEAMPDGGEVDITTEDNEGYGFIYIQDSGVGISEGLKDRIFDPFFSTKGDGSMGLGLSISYAAVKRHRGVIEMSSKEGQGTIFYIKIPLMERERKSRPRVPGKKIGESQILIIQGEDVVRELLSHLLTLKGCKVDTAVTGMEGLGKMKRRKFDMVIADTDMLDMEGAAFVKTGRDINPGLSIVLIKEDKGEIGSGTDDESSADLNIYKPLDVNRFVRLIAGLLIVRS